MDHWMRARMRATYLALGALVILGAAPSGAVPTTTLITRHDAALPGSVALSGLGATSGDGRYTVFVGMAPFGALDANNANDVFLYDAQTASVSLVSHAAASFAASANGPSQNPQISKDGNWVVFETLANDLIANEIDVNGSQDVVLWERATGALTLISRAAGSAPPQAANGYSIQPTISDDGSYVAFYSTANDVVAGASTGGHGALYLFSRTAGTSQMISHVPGNTTTNGNTASVLPMVSGDGKFVAFQSYASNLVAGQSDGASTPDVFLWSRLADAIEVVSHTTAASTTAASATSVPLGVSADGGQVAFSSDASAALLASGASDTNATTDVFVYAHATGAVRLVSHAAGSAAAANAGSTAAVISADGTRLAFTSMATNLVTGQSDSGGSPDVFTADTATLATALVTHAAASTTTAVGGSAPVISGDGARIAYLSVATSLVTGQTGSGQQAFVYTTSGGTNRLVSHANGVATQGGNGATAAVRLAGDGASVVLESTSGNLVAAGPASGTPSIFRWSAGPDASTLLRAPNPEAATASGNVGAFAISRDGRYVAFLSNAMNQTTGAAAGSVQVYLWDGVTGTVTLVSRHAGSAAASNSSADAVDISGDGRFVVFASNATDLVAGQTDPVGGDDVFLWDRVTGVTVMVSHAALFATTAANGASTAPVIDYDGSHVAFLSLASNLRAAALDGNGVADVYLWDRSTGSATLVSHLAASDTTPGDGACGAPVIDDAGDRVAFQSKASNLAPGQVDTNAGWDLFLYDVPGGQNALVSHVAAASATASSNAMAGTPDAFALSRDGGTVVFYDYAPDLVSPPLSASFSNIFRYRASTGAVQLVSHQAGNAGAEGNGYGAAPLVSADGLTVAYGSTASNLVTGVADTNGKFDVFVWSSITDATALASHAAGSFLSTGGGASSPLALSADGSTVVFASTAADLVPGVVDTNQTYDLFAADVATGEIQLLSHRAVDTSQAGNTFTLFARVSGDGQAVAFASDASDLVAGDYNEYRDLFLSRLGRDFFTLPPCRAYDSRQSSALVWGVTRTIALGGVCGVPVDAKAVSVNLTVTQPTSGGSLVAWAANSALPATNNLSFATNQTRANNAMVALDPATGQLALRPLLDAVGTAHVIVDVNGYFK